MKGRSTSLIIQDQALVHDENMSNITSASGEASVSSAGSIYPLSQQYYFPPPNQTQLLPIKKKRNQPGNPDPDAEVIALTPKTLLTTNRFVCEICNKGFPRDQNLQLHRRGHNLPWKLKQRTNNEVVRKKVYVCPEPSCVHHHPSRALGDLTGIKKHFYRKHGEKKWKCDKCSKRYAVQSDWKAHSKICGTREYRCVCGTLFSRRDSFITHKAFCEAMVDECTRPIPHEISTSHKTPHNQHSQLMTNSHCLNPFSMKMEQSTDFSSRIDQQATPRLLPSPSVIEANPGPPVTVLSSSVFSTRLDQNLSQDQCLALHIHHQNSNPIRPGLEVGPSFQPYHPTNSPHMSATSLLQKAAQMAAAISSGSVFSSSQTTLRPHQADHVSSGSGTGAPPSVQEMVMASLPLTAGFHGSTFENSFSAGIFSRRMSTDGGEAGHDDLTKDFLGHGKISF